jgi:hypothetical protein
LSVADLALNGVAIKESTTKDQEETTETKLQVGVTELVLNCVEAL